MLPVEICQSILNEEAQSGTLGEGAAPFSLEEARRLRDAFYEAARAQVGTARAADVAAGRPTEKVSTDAE